MKPVFQTIFGEKRGNCWSACIASLMELRIDQVPNFCAGEDKDFEPSDPNKWAMNTELWMRELGYAGLYFIKPNVYRPECWHIVSGRSHRGSFDHAVVAFGVDLIHDPHPSGNFLACKTQDLVDSFMIFPIGIILPHR